MKIICALLAATCLTSSAFTSVPLHQKSSLTSLNAGNVPYSTRNGEPGGYQLVNDPDGYVQGYYARDPSGVTHYGYRKEDHVPGTTGGTGGSTLVSDYIVKDSVYGPNYHYVQHYRRQRHRTAEEAPPSQKVVPQLRQPWNKSPSGNNYSAPFPKPAAAKKEQVQAAN